MSKQSSKESDRDAMADSPTRPTDVVKFSIITLVYNRKEDLERTARSVPSPLFCCRRE